MLASGSDDESVILWSLTTLVRLGRPLTRYSAKVHSIAFSPNGGTLAVGWGGDTSGYSHTALLDLADHQWLGQDFKGHTMVFSPDGKTLATGGWDENAIMLWDLDAKQLIGQGLGHASTIANLAFAPDGRVLASSSVDGGILLWDVSVEKRQERACRRANRNLTQDEWHQYFGNRVYRKTCPNI
jgi:eukaryotic-like serine/threonine-protein kinase